MYSFILWNERADLDKAYNNGKDAVVSFFFFFFSKKNNNRKHQVSLQVSCEVNLFNHQGVRRMSQPISFLTASQKPGQRIVAIFWYHAMNKKAHVVGFFGFISGGPF